MTDFKRINMTSPKGVMVFPKLNEPDTKFNPEGDYTVKLSMRADSPEVQAFVAKLEPLHADAVEKAAPQFKALKPEQRAKLKAKGITAPVINDFFTTMLNEDETPNGDITFNFKMKASGVSKKTGKRWERKPTIFDAKGMVLKNVPPIWGGTVAKVAFSIVEGGYFVSGTGAAGISLGLEAVQIIELRSGQGRSAKEMGFGAEEGFDGSASEFASEEGTQPSDTSADADF